MRANNQKRQILIFNDWINTGSTNQILFQQDKWETTKDGMSPSLNSFSYWNNTNRFILFIFLFYTYIYVYIYIYIYTIYICVCFFFVLRMINKYQRMAGSLDCAIHVSESKCKLRVVTANNQENALWVQTDLQALKHCKWDFSINDESIQTKMFLLVSIFLY